MHHPDVLDEVGLLVEAVFAVVADEWTLIQMNRAQVAIQVALRFVLKRNGDNIVGRWGHRSREV